MATYARVLLSGSTSGKPIAVAATATIGTTIHTAVAGATSFDEIYAWATNISGAAATLNVEWGIAGDPGAMTKAYSIPANSPPIPIATGQVLNGALLMTAFCATGANLINITGFVNRIS